jgi:HK97 family phage portal protein
MAFFAPVLARIKAAVGTTTDGRSPGNAGALQSVGGWSGGGWFGIIREAMPGNWQKNIEVECTRNILAFSAVYAAIALISSDVAKLRIKLVEQLPSGIWREVTDRNSPFWPVLRKPNPFQTRVQFLAQWMASLLLYGNTYVLKQRDNRGVVTALFILDARTVVPAVAPNGDVFYRLKMDNLAGVVRDDVTVPANEIIHDRMNAFFHPLIGISPIYACGASATQGIRIQNNSANFFENMSRPSGVLTGPDRIGDETAARLKNTWESGFSGANSGRVAVLGEGLKYEAMTIPPADAQLIEQLKWTVEDVARCFNVPTHKLASSLAPSFNNVGALNQDYYAQTLQIRIESIEILLDEGLGLDVAKTANLLGTELDLEGLLRMDPKSRAETDQIRMQSGTLAPNEARMEWDLPPVEGGDSPMMQQQNWSLEALAARPPPSANAAPTAGPDAGAPNGAPQPQQPPDAAPLAPDAPAKPEPDKAAAKAFVAALIARFAAHDDADI